MQVERMNRVELLLPGEDVPNAVRVFSEVLGGHFSEPEDLPGVHIRTSVDYALGIELYGPIDGTSPLAGVFDTKPRQGAIGPIVWEVTDLDTTRAEVEDLGFTVVYEYGEPGRRQIHLDADQLFGFGVTFTEHHAGGTTTPSTRVRNFQRVELLVGGEEIEQARDTFTTLLGASFSPLWHIEAQDILTTTDDRNVGIELLAPASTNSSVHRQLLAKGRGSIGPLVWFVEDLDAVRADVTGLGYRIQFEYGEPGARQLHLDTSQLFGYGVTFTERKPGEHLVP
jgi:hypothetical protein